MLTSCQQNAEQNHSKNITNKPLEGAVKCKYLERHKHIIIARTKKLKADYEYIQAAPCCPVRSRISSSSTITKNIDIKIRKTVMLLAVLYGHETWSLA